MELYEGGRYAELNPDWHEADAPEKAEALAGALRSLALKPRRVVDVGCGTGEVLRRMKRCFDREGLLPETEWEGWDVAAEAIARAAEKAEPRLRFVHGDYLSDGQPADLVLCVDTFEHVADDVAFLSRLRSRGRWFLFRIPLDLSVLDVLRPHRMLEARRRFGHRHAYTRELAFSVLREAGYEVLTWRHHRVPPELGGMRSRVVDLGRRLLVGLAEDAAVHLVGGYSLIALAVEARKRS